MYKDGEGRYQTEYKKEKKIEKKNQKKKSEYFQAFWTSVLIDEGRSAGAKAATPRPYYVKNLTWQRLLGAQGITNLPTWGELKTLAPLEFSVNHM